MTTTFNTGRTVFSLSTDHSASSYGQPVLLIGDAVFGPTDAIPPTADDPFAFAGPQPAKQFVSAGVAHHERNAALNEFGAAFPGDPDAQMAAYRAVHGDTSYPEIARRFCEPTL